MTEEKKPPTIREMLSMLPAATLDAPTYGVVVLSLDYDGDIATVDEATHDDVLDDTEISVYSTVPENITKAIVDTTYHGLHDGGGVEVKQVH